MSEASSFFEPCTALVQSINGRLQFPSLVPISSSLDWVDALRQDPSFVSRNTFDYQPEKNSLQDRIYCQVLKHNETMNCSNSDRKCESPYISDTFHDTHSPGNYSKYHSYQSTTKYGSEYRNNHHKFDNLNNSPIENNLTESAEGKKEGITGSPIDTYFPTQKVASNCTKIDQILNEKTINPIELNFLPKELWLTNQATVRSVFQNFFKARSTKNLRFEHKLWNALALSKKYPELICVLGVYWVSNELIKVNRDIFGALINLTKPAAALFNNQGSFLTHGFVEVTRDEAIEGGIQPELIEDVDESIVRLFRHSIGLLTASSTKNDVAMCRWCK